MSTTPTEGEIRPFVIPTHSDSTESDDGPMVIPLLRLRGYDRPVIEPEQCRVTDCLVCIWRKAGLLNAPTHQTHIVRESVSGYTCHSSYCPGCNTVRCICPPDDFEEIAYEHDYALGHDHGTADGPDNRPSCRWCTDAGLDAAAYLAGYDAGCVAVSLVPVGDVPYRLWNELDDGLPF